MKQRYSSANTSINSKRLPAIYGMVRGKINPSDQVLDYGCGKYFDNYNLGGNFYGYDPFNRPEADVLGQKYDVVICSKVLNVIAEKEVRADLLLTLKSLSTDKVYITVYEGNGSGIGKATKDDCYQLNRRRCDYIPEIVEAFGSGNVHYNRRGFFECKVVK